MILNWAIIGSGDVVSRLVKNSFNTKYSKVKYVLSKEINLAKKVCTKYGYGISNITQKRCSCCGSVERVTHFYNDSYSNDGYSSWCKSCVKTYSKNYREDLKLVA